MEQIISKEEFEELMNLEGEARGVAIKGEANFILKEKGKEGLKKLEETMAKFGYPIKYKKLKALDFYPLGYEAATTLVIKKIFNFSEKDFRRLGTFEAKSSLIVRMFMKYFCSIKLMVREAPKMWEKYFTIGSLTISEFDEKKGLGILRVENFKHHPYYCRTLEGFLSCLVKMITKSNAICKETKCIHWGDKYHEFLLRW